MLKIAELKTEYRTDPIGLDVKYPRFSWILESDKNDTVQASYTLTITNATATVWNTGEVKSEQSVLIKYAGESLAHCTRYNISLTVTDNHGEMATTNGYFETGLMNYANMTAKWITHGYEDKFEPCPVYVKEFELSGKVKSARLYASALGVYKADINAERVGDAYLSPGWTSYNTRVQYQTYDVTDMLKDSNRIELTVANGWYSGELGFAIAPNHYGSRTAAWAQIEVTYDDDRTETIITDDSWQYGTGVRRYAEIYHGEIIDHRHSLKVDGQALVHDHPINILTAQESELVRITERLKPQQLIITPKGEVVFDFGQNLTGVVEVRLNCPESTEIILQHAEVLDKHGNFYTENLRSAKATDTFICVGDGEEVFMPEFTFHGFRYLKVEGLGDNPNPDWFTACVLHTDMKQTGHFECSDRRINRLQQNIQWGQRGNFLDIPTDCPQRDERLGWTGDAQVFASTAAFNYDTALFFSKWLRDIKAEQTLEFGVPHVVPNILGQSAGAAAWGDAATVIPWEIYLAHADKRILEEQYDSMKDWVEYIRSKAGDTHLWQTGFQYADWLALDKEEGSDRVGATDVYFVASAYYALSTDIVAKAADVLGRTEDAKLYAKLHNDIVAAFQREYFTETGRIVSETQTGCVLALHFNLAKPEHRARILKSLETNIAKHNNHLTTGFVGTPYLCHALTNSGRHELAGKLLLQRDYPSWLYAVDMGATTIWERWNSMMPDGSFDESGMNSFNHYAYGSIGSWMYQRLCGLQILEPGYKRSRIAPMPVKGITSAEASVKTPYGKLMCKWSVKNKKITVDITVPANTSAVVCLPEKSEKIAVGSGSYHYEYATDMNLEYEYYSFESTLGEILDNPVAMAVLKQFAPDMAENPMIEFARKMTITQISANMPAGGEQLFIAAIKAANEAERESQ